jgi:hypothetical protein
MLLVATRLQGATAVAPHATECCERATCLPVHVDQTHMSRIKNFAAGTLLMITSIVICLACAEVGVRTIHPQQLFEFRPDLYQPVNGLGWTFRPSIETGINTGGRLGDDSYRPSWIPCRFGWSH